MASPNAGKPLYGYSKNEKLKSRKTLEGLFAQGRSFTEFPVKLWWAPLLGMPAPDPEAPLVAGAMGASATNSLVHQVGVGVSSRHFKKATDRNRIKRLLREAYRLQKANLQNPQPLAVFLLFVGKELPTQSQLMVSVLKALEKLSRLVQPSAAAANPGVDFVSADPDATPLSSAPPPPETSGHV